MAVQAQYPPPSSTMLFNNTTTSDLEDLPCLFQGYKDKYFDELRMVFSEPQSELTCNVSASRKRSNRDENLLLPPPKQHHMFQHQQHKLQIPQHHNLYSKLQRVEKSGTSSVCNPLQENRLHGSGGTSTSALSPYHFSSQSQDFNTNLEFDTLIRLHNEKLRTSLQEARKRHSKSLLSLLEQKVLTRLQEKETELANANCKNAELEEKLKQISAENEIWFNVAQNNEAIACSLRTSLEQIILQNQNQSQVIKEGFGDNDGKSIVVAVDEDAQSCCNQGLVEVQEENKTSLELRERKYCKVCHENETCVLVLPCRHLCLCKNCEPKIDLCPICNFVKKASLQISSC